MDDRSRSYCIVPDGGSWSCGDAGDRHLFEICYAAHSLSSRNKIKADDVKLYAILRRDGFTDGPTLEAAAARSTQAGNDMSDDIRWIRSYVLDEESGALGTVCIYEASSEEAIRKHAKTADLPVSEIIPVADTVVVRPDPE
ncbi:MAG TPA: DUF4242 domain-containing protein [Woeseiaceae bacterium]|nr:DUF4242 domain-containing protein [Woeseiaceae bacterium]